MPETYVIFITGKDYFKTDQPVYHIERINVETGEYFNDRAHIIYTNSKYENDNEIGRLLHDLRCNDPDKMYCDIIKRDTKYFKTNTHEVETMCQVIRLVSQIECG